MLLAAGALAGLGQMSLPVIVATAVGATLLADSIWYGLGRMRGNRIIEMLSRFSLAHGASIRRAKELFFVHRAQCLIVAKFLPGINPLAVGLAGIFAVAPTEFLLCDATGALVWQDVDDRRILLRGHDQRDRARRAPGSARRCSVWPWRVSSCSSWSGTWCGDTGSCVSSPSPDSARRISSSASTPARLSW